LKAVRPFLLGIGTGQRFLLFESGIGEFLLARVQCGNSFLKLRPGFVQTRNRLGLVCLFSIALVDERGNLDED
jgi:hypothetical protein